MKFDCKRITKLIVSVVVSQFGALILVILYLIGGGALFVFLELENEKSSCKTSRLKYLQKLNETTERAVAISEGGYNRTVLYTQILYMLGNFSKDVYTLGVSPLLKCDTLGEPGNLPGWNLPNSIYFCATIMTTIGYGHIAPSTNWGRIVCIIYAFIGIPLMVLFLSSLGELLAGIFRSAYMNMCCCKCFVHPRHLITSDTTHQIQDLADIKKPQDYSEENNQSANGPPMKIANLVEVYEEDDDETSEVNIPIIVVTGFLFCYMIAGAALFKIWEDWDLTAGVYFSFITVSTIGFGDLYPAKDTIGSDTATVELIVGSIYALIGLAILSMCLNLIQDEISGKFQWLGQKLGIQKKPEELTDDTEDIETQRTNLDYGITDDSKPIIIRPKSGMVNNSAVAFSNDSFENSFDSNTFKRK